ncbi:MAG TPA: hypothetical protein VN648_06440, partial [Candidatus Methylomirabilis sp.]|nr:hypothetical protein [Candidatus Methylomirabilis sp.]
MGDLRLAVLLHEVNLFRIAVEIRSVAANLLLDVLRNLEADVHGCSPNRRLHKLMHALVLKH